MAKVCSKCNVEKSESDLMATEISKEIRKSKACPNCHSLSINKIRRTLNHNLMGKYRCGKCKSVFSTPIIRNILRSKTGASTIFIKIMRSKEAKKSQGVNNENL
jgi:ssDNA-binding Zn-finger/Zn-ribbon topoisomerase 1